jgi:hypothetical protein
MRYSAIKAYLKTVNSVTGMDSLEVANTTIKGMKSNIRVIFLVLLGLNPIKCMMKLTKKSDALM